MTSNSFSGSCEETSVVLIWFAHDDVKLREELEGESDIGGEGEADTGGYNLYLKEEEKEEGGRRKEDTYFAICISHLIYLLSNLVHAITR